LAAKNADPLTNPLSVEMGAQSWTNTCGVCHIGGGQMEYDRDLNDYSAGSEPGDAFVLKYARPDDPTTTTVDETSWNNVESGWLDASNKAEMDCLMCHLDGSNAGSAWLKTLDCGVGNPIGPMVDPTCSGTSAYGPAFRTVTIGDGVTDYDMYNRNFGLKQRRNDLIASMGAGAKGTFDVNDQLDGIDWGATAVLAGGPTGLSVGDCVDGATAYNDGGACIDYSYAAFPFGDCEGQYATPYVINAADSVNCIKVDSTQIATTPKSENCSVCHARDDNTMGLPGMMAMKTGYGNYGLIHDPSNPMPSGNMGASSDLDTDNGAGAVNDDYWFDFGCKTGMGKRAHKITATGDDYGVNGRYGMSMFLPSTLDMDPLTVPNAGDPVPGKMPDIDVHDRNGMECASCHYAVGSTTGTGYEDIPAGEHHGFDYPAERIYAMDHQFAQADSFPDTKGKNNLDAKIRCDGCHIVRDNPKITDNGGTLVAPTPLHPNLPVSHLDLIGCVTCHIPETYSAPGRLKYRDWTAGFARGTFRNVLDWNFNLVEGNHNTVPSVRKWATKNGESKIYPVLPSLLPTWYEMIPNSGAIAANDAGMTVDDNLYDADTLLSYPSPVKNRDLQMVGEAVRDAHPEFDIRLNGGNTVPLFDGFQIVDSWEIDTAVEIQAMMDEFAAQAAAKAADPSLDVADARYVSFLNVIQADFDVTHGVVPKEWALGGSERGGCVSCHSSMAMSLDGGMTMNPNYSPYSIGFFEGYTQPVANAGLPGFAVGGYEIAKNWMAMFADFDAAMMCGMGEPALSQTMTDTLTPMLTGIFGPDGPLMVPMMLQMMGDDDSANHHNYYFNPMTNEPAMSATCSSNSWFSNNPMFGTAGWCMTDTCMYDTDMDQIPDTAGGSCTPSADGPMGEDSECNQNAQLQHVIGMMNMTFDAAMGFPAGSSAQMGMNDGVAGIQGFTLKELQTSGTLGCNPFAGPASMSPMAGQSVNACVPNYADADVKAMFDPAMQPAIDCIGSPDQQPDGSCTTPGPFAGASASDTFAMMMNGTCGAVTPGVCAGGFRHNSGCANDTDCQGTMDETAIMEIFHNPMGLFLSRSAAVSHFKQDLQQVFTVAGDPTSSLVKWSAGGDQNPNNPAHVNKWDQAQYCYDRVNGANPLTPNVEACISLADPLGPTGGMGSDGMGNLQIATVMSANQFLGYTPARLAELMDFNTLADSGAPVNDGMHAVHTRLLGMTPTTCLTCHVANDDFTMTAGMTEADAAGPTVYDKDQDGVAEAQTFTLSEIIGADGCNEWAVDNADGIIGNADDYVCLDVVPGVPTGEITCNSSCHADYGTVTPGNPTADASSATGTDVTASVGALHAISDNNIITVNAQRSSCTGAFNSECTYVWNLAGCVAVGGSDDGSVLVAEGTDGVNCVVSVDVTDTVTAETVNSGNVTVAANGTLDDPGPVASDVASLNNGDGTCTVSASDLDGAVAARIYWGNRESQIIDVADLAGGVTNYCGANVRVTLIDAAHNAATLNL
jgi:hypothetical protein